MEFLPTVNLVPWGGPVLGGFTVLLILVTLILFLIQVIFKTDALSILEPIFRYSIMGIFVFLAVTGGMWVMQARNGQENLQANLHQKYEITSVTYDDKAVSVTPTKSKSQIILVNLENGKQASFLLTQDSTTNEPTLSEVPGKSDVTVEDITR